MKKIIIIALLILAALTGCSGGGAKPGVAPAEGPAPTPSDTEDPTPNFHQKYTYDDGITVEVTKIKTGRLSQAKAEEAWDPKVKAGMDYATFTLRVKNEGKDRISIEGEGGGIYAEVTYGPEGAGAISPGMEQDPISGTLLPGRAKSGESTWIIPRRYWNDVVMEVHFTDASDEPRDSVVFTGPIN
jgi:hypothetical protein